VDGVILASVDAEHSDDLLRRLLARGKGLVLIDRDDHPKLACHRVLTDDELVGRLATEHLISLGHRRIAHLTGPPLIHARRRLEGYRAAMAAHGLEIAEDWVVHAGFLEADGYAGMKRLLETSPEVTAVFAANDPAAMGAMRAVWERGLAVPKDISIVGAGAIAYGEMLKVPLTTVTWSRRDVGINAARLILDQIEHHPDGPYVRQIVPPEVLFRESSGPAPA
jgi:LacI family transcriptional regulator